VLYFSSKLNHVLDDTLFFVEILKVSMPLEIT